MSKKIIALALAFAFAFSFTAKAVTIEELQAQIQQLQLLLAKLQGQQTTGMYCFNTDLKYGMTSNDVKNLQIVLGVTPQSGYFGPLTLAAVKNYQASKGIITTGYVGPLTRQALNAQYCVPPAPTTTTTVAPETTTTTVAPSYGTLSMTSYPVSNPVTTFYGNGTYEVVAGQFKATGSDITVKKVGVKITQDSATTFPWNAFTSLSLWEGSTKLGEVAVTQTNAIENTFAQIYTFNISGLNWVIPNGQQKVLTLKATVVANPPSGVTTSGFWKIEMLTDIVYSDTAGVTYSSVSGSSISLDNITISSSQTSSITVTAATDNPLAGNIIGSTSATTRVDLLKFNVKVENVNATFTSGTITATSTTASYLTAVELWDGSTLVASAAPGTGGAVSWSNFTLPVAAGTTKTLTVKGVIAQLTSGYAGGDTFYISTGPVLTGVDSNSNVVTANGSSVTGNNQYLYLVAPVFAYVSHSVSVRGTNSTNHPMDIGDTAITFAVTAYGGDIYIPSKSAVATGIYETLTKPSGATSTTSTTWTCNTPAYDGTTYWRIPSGNTANCTFSTLVTNTDTYAGYFRVAIGGIKWGTTTTSYSYQTWGLSTLKTNDFYLGN